MAFTFSSLAAQATQIVRRHSFAMTRLLEPVLSSSPRGDNALVFYYGRGERQVLSAYKRAVLQPSHYLNYELDWLKEHQVETYAYLSLGEDASAAKEWHRGVLNADWNTAYVRLNDAWQEHVLRLADRALEQGFAGLFLDTLEMVDFFPEEREAMLELVHKLRQLAGAKPILANRGFSLMPELSQCLDGLVFEGFSTRWTAAGQYQKLTAEELAWTEKKALELRRRGLKVYALDYADSPDLGAFAEQRAWRFGFSSALSNRELTRLGIVQ